MRLAGAIWILLGGILLEQGFPLAAATPDDLAGGVLICHNPPGMSFTNPPPADGWCRYYSDNFAITDCESQNPSVPAVGPSVWFVLSAWWEEKSWCGTFFGFGDYSPEICEFANWAPCAPGQYLEIPSAGWPGPGEGTAFVTIGAPWMGNFVPVYYFAAYAYGPGQVPLSTNPDTDFVGWVTCLTPPQEFSPSCLPAMGIGTQGTSCCPSAPTDVCCTGAQCSITTESECLAMGGEFRPGIGSCDPNPCVHPCCLGEECRLMSGDECGQAGGEFHPELASCEPNPCLWERHVCCIDEECRLATAEECHALHGYFYPREDACDPADLCRWLKCVCCIGPECYLLHADSCSAICGNWLPMYHSCDPSPCIRSWMHVCCVGNECHLVGESSCECLGGEWHPDWESCEPNPCEGTPVKPISWGRIKTIYR